jgi:hypothetical protein
VSAWLVLTYVMVMANVAPLPISIAADKKCPAEKNGRIKWPHIDSGQGRIATGSTSAKCHEQTWPSFDYFISTA